MHGGRGLGGKVFSLPVAVFLAAIGLLIPLGLWTGEKWAEQLDAGMREDLLRQTSELGGTINPELLQKLAFTAEDQETPAFKVLREQMRQAAASIPSAKWSYSMAMRGGRILFGPDSIAHDDPQYTPPGDEYKDAPPELLRCFEKKTPATAGPYTDEWGTFVSAFEPILDPSNDEVIAVIGVDVPATDWNSRLSTVRIRPPLTVIVLALVLAAGGIITRRRNRRIKPDALKLRGWIIVPTALAVLVGMILLGSYYWYQIRRDSERQILQTTEQARGEWNRRIGSEVQLLKAQISRVSSEPALLDAWRKRDFQALSALSAPVCEELKREYRITHFYFFTPERVCFLRAHQPERHGDTVERSTLIVAEQTGEDAWGVELGPLGTFTLRYVRPWRQDGVLVGFLELGMEIEHLAKQLAKNMHIDYLVAIQKEQTTREKYDAGRAAFGFSGQWDDFPSFVVAHQTVPKIPKKVADWLSHNQTAAAKNHVFDVRQDGNTYACGVINLPDAQGHNAARLVVMRNTTAESGLAIGMLLLNTAMTGMLLAALLMLLWSVTSAAEKQLAAAFAAVRESGEHLAATLRSIGDGVISTDRLGNVTSLNTAAETLTGWDAAGAKGRPAAEIFRLINAQTGAEEESPVTRALSTGESTGRGKHDTMIDRAGARHIVASNCAPIRDTGGLTTGTVLVFRDVTVEYESHERLKRANDRFYQLAKQSRTVHWEVDAEGLYTFVSPVSEAVLGYTPEELVDKMHFYDLHPEEGREHFKASVFEGFARREPFVDLENPLLHKDGRVLWVSSDGIPLLDDIGNLTGYRGTDTDITAQRLVREKLHQLSQAVEQSPVSIVITDTCGNIEYVNPKFADVTGYTQAEAVGKNPRILKSGEIPAEEYQQLWSTITAGKVWRGEFHNRRKNGELYWESASISPIQDRDGRIIHFLAVKEDITARKRVEAELNETNRQLVLARSRAEAANTAKSDFLANMSHEIRTPMNGVIGMTGLLLETELSQEQQQYAQIVRTSGEALLAIINDILDFSKIEAGKLELETLDFDLRATLEDTADLLAIKAREKNLDLVCIIEPGVPILLRGDPGRLRQIFVNLGGNAVKFTHCGGITIRASLEHQTEERAALRFTVTDTGIGIPADKREMLFSPFTQADSSTTRKYGGTGLGLAISKQLAELMGGTIGLESTENLGSTFWFTAMFEKQPADRISKPEPLADLSGERILVVDDHDTNRLLVTTLLKSWGCRFAEAQDGETALKCLLDAVEQGEPYRIALLDMQMPGMDGAELSRRIKGHRELCKTQLIMMTSVAERGDAARFSALGFAGYLTKPLRQSHLRDCIAMVVGRDHSPDTAAAAALITRHTISEAQKRRVRILLAEDNTTNQLVAVKLLEKLGYRADVAANGQEAIATLRAIPYDLVLMDCQMPEMDGFEATRHIRNPESEVPNHDVPIIAMTAHAMKGDREKCLEAGMNDYISKPVSPHALMESLNRWIPREASGTVCEIRAGDTEPATAAQPPTHPVFDRAAMLSRLLDDEALAASVIQVFLADIPLQIEALRKRLESGDAGGSERQAHTLKGAAANVGGDALSAAASEIETASKSGNLAAALNHLPELEKQFLLLKSEMLKQRDA